jgi:general secretion pathway protein D
MRWIKIIFLCIFLLNAKQIELNFKNLEINDFIKMVAKITNKNILLTQTIHGKVNFISVKPINEKEVYDILLNILRSRGYTLIEDNGFLKVVRSADAYRDAPPLANENKLNQLQTDIIYLNNTPARVAFSQVNFLLSRYGKIVVNNDKNLLIITDYPKNLNLIKKILKKIDTQNKKYAKFYN